MKNGKKLLILLGVLVVVAGAYLLARSLTAKQEAAETAAEDAKTVTLASRSSDEIAALTWTYNGETATLERAGGVWTDPEDSAFPADQTKAGEMANAVCSVTSSQALTDVTDYTQYGLDAPAVSITVRYNDGTQDQYEFGDENSLTSKYYVRYNGGDVEMMDDTILKVFQVSRWDLIQEETIPSLDNPAEITLTSASGVLDLRDIPDSGLTYTDAYEWFLKQDAGYVPVDPDDATGFVTTLEGLKWTSVAAYNATAQQLSDWGFDDPAGTVSVRYTPKDGQETTFTLELGDYTDGGCYARLAGSAMVYVLDADTAEGFLFASYDGMRTDDICLLDMDALESFDVILDGQTYTIVPGEKVAEATAEATAGATATASAEPTAGASAETETVKTYTCGGKELDADTVTALLASIKGMHATSTGGDAANARGAVLSIVFRPKDAAAGYEEMTLTFLGYDSANYLTEFNGWNYMLADKATVDGLVTTLRGLLE